MGREPDEVARQSGPDGIALVKNRRAASDPTRRGTEHTSRDQRARGPSEPQAQNASRRRRAGSGRPGRAGRPHRHGTCLSAHSHRRVVLSTLRYRTAKSAEQLIKNLKSESSGACA